MLRVEEFGINLQQLSLTDQALLLNRIFAVANMRLEDAANQLRQYLPLGWYVYKGGHHIAIGLVNHEHNAVLTLIDVEDPWLSMHGYPDYLCEERRSIGLSLDGTGS